MRLSPEREAELVEQNLPKIYRAVDNYMARYSKKNYIPYDDFVQEASVAFIEYVRRCETEEQLNKFPWYDAIHAMSELVLRSQGISVPQRTSDFSNTIRSLPLTVSYDTLVSGGINIDGMSKHWVPDMDTKLDFNSFMSDKDEAVQRIAAMRLYGMSMREIASQFGMCFQNIQKKLGVLREQYEEFTKEEDEDG